MSAGPSAKPPASNPDDQGFDVMAMPAAPVTSQTDTDSVALGTPSPDGAGVAGIARVERFYYRGPWPPELLRQYEELYPGATKLILDNTIEESRHRRTEETETRKGNEGRANWGVWTSFGSILGSLVAACIFAALNHAVEGAAIPVAVVGTIGIVFFHGARARDRHSPATPPASAPDKPAGPSSVATAPLPE